MSDTKSFCPFSLATPILVLVAALLVGTPRDARADGGCKPDGRQCATNMSCCSRQCVKPTSQHGKALFGVCGTTTTTTTSTTTTTMGCTPNCLPNNNCGDDGCGGSCGTCTAPATCTDIFGSRICAVECLYTCASGNQSFCLPRFHPPDCTACTQAECDIFCTAGSSTCTQIDCNPAACQ